MGPAKPQLTIIVPSFHRPNELFELLERLFAQTLKDIEILIVEQSEDPDLIARLEALGDPRIRVLARPPLGLPGARNEGIRHARADVLLFIDDDDLPIFDDWAAAHLENFADPLCMGAVGRLSQGKHGDPPSPLARLVKWGAFEYTLFKDPRTLAFGSLRKENIDFLTFSGGSIRKELFERVGGFDEGLPINEEHSFFFRYQRVRKPGEYFVFDPRPIIWRRVDVRGGLDRRAKPDWHRKELADRIFYYHAIVAHYFPWRFRLLYPLFPLRALWGASKWVWDPDNRGHSTSERVSATVDLIVGLPRAVVANGFRRARAEVRRVRHL